MDQVLQDVWHETKVPLMVYATEAALNVARTPLPMPLQRFALAENKAFQQELDQETTGPPADPISPSKRKHRADSIDSMDSNRATLGSDDGHYGFEGGHVSTEAPEVVTVSRDD